jgi:hypothetical protein
MAGGHAPAPGTLGGVLADRRRRVFVGRAAEVELFRAAIDAPEAPFSVLHVHGPGGIGKSSLLARFQEIAVAGGATVAPVDGRDLTPSPVAVLGALADHLEVPPGDGAIAASMGGGGRVVLLVDSYDSLLPLDDWVRTRLLPRLPATAVTVLASRNPPSRAWRVDPAWRDLVRIVSLRNLDPEDSRAYLAAVGVDERLHARLVEVSYGHPLGLALLADVVSRGGTVGRNLPPDLVEALLERFVETVPDDGHRRALAVCALARTTTEALLRDVLGFDDAHDLFDWLRSLSFVQARTDGLAPHDLARDALDADLRWRDPEGYGEVFRTVRAHASSRLRTTTGRAQQRAIFDLKFLFRQVRSVLSPVDWGSWGDHYPDRARPADEETIVDLVRTWEGAASAALVRRWLHEQPGGFWVIRGQDEAVSGLLAIVDLTAAAATTREADPGARAAWAFAHRASPPRPGETVSLCRFIVDRHAYQEPSPTLNATPILTLQHQLTTPRLAWDFLALAAPDRWNDYFAAADMPRAEGADFTVGTRRFGLFAHDFRAVPVDTWTELWTERALAQDVGIEPPRRQATVVVLSQADFEAAVRQGLRDLRRPDLLARNPLVRTRLLTDRAADGRPDARTLQAALREAVDALARHPRDDTLLRAVTATYVRPTRTQEAAAVTLGLPFSTYRRHLTQGVARVVSWLWDREVYGQG